ncbi:MAG: coenzyme F420-0:L-glutamate ligase [Candidatus Bathyarchaeia archaeon]
MTKYRALALTTGYWKPGEDYLACIAANLAGKVRDADFVVVSEKALSTALGNILDESTVKAGFNAKVISRFWMRFAWGYFLSIICHFGKRLTQRLRQYPLEAGSRHKHVALQRASPLQALMWGSEGGIDGSNLPFSYVSLPLRNPYKVADEIRQKIWRSLKRKVCVIIVDTDKTYSFRNFHFTPRPKPMKGIYSLGGVIAYVIGRALKLRKRSTPLAVAGCSLQAEEALKIANIADRARGVGSGATVWDMAARFHVAITEIDWRMLAKMEHKPLVIVRKE